MIKKNQLKFFRLDNILHRNIEIFLRKALNSIFWVEFFHRRSQNIFCLLFTQKTSTICVHVVCVKKRLYCLTFEVEFNKRNEKYTWHINIKSSKLKGWKMRNCTDRYKITTKSLWNVTEIDRENFLSLEVVHWVVKKSIGR